ncbi:nuclease HARBI1 [Labeo rohita]|uniref:Nuclease HARBI1 n=1 Tax=Labeo rohita TaxID=84645 RepID=A0A498LBB5_LABRO|nr:nuclease HARBI1 [Labeo rohita]RXN30173.1 nuclease HARBI1 [Labeo rohita]
MSKTTFDMLCQRLSTFLSYDDTTFRRAIPLQMHVGVALWWLATGVGYCTLAHLFGISSASVCLIVNDFCQAMRDELLREYIQFPQLDELQNVIRGFKTRWGFPQCAGAIDGSHIPVIAPSEDHTDYFNRKGWHSVIFQAVVDHRFDEIQGIQVPIMLLGDPAYSLRPWIMKGYPDTGNLTDGQRYVNQRLSRARMTVECAFGRLKGRWRCLAKRLDVDIALVPTVIAACCTLHNICEKHNEKYGEDLPAAGPPEATGEDGDPVGAVDTQPLRVREALTQHFATQR